MLYRALGNQHMCMLTYSKEITSVEKVLKLEMSEGWFGKLAKEMVEGEDAVSAVADRASTPSGTTSQAAPGQEGSKQGQSRSSVLGSESFGRRAGGLFLRPSSGI